MLINGKTQYESLLHSSSSRLQESEASTDSPTTKYTIIDDSNELIRSYATISIAELNNLPKEIEKRSLTMRSIYSGKTASAKGKKQEKMV